MMYILPSGEEAAGRSRVHCGKLGAVVSKGVSKKHSNSGRMCGRGLGMVSVGGESVYEGVGRWGRVKQERANR